MSAATDFDSADGVVESPPASSFLRAGSVLLRNWRLLVTLPLVAAAVALGVSLFARDRVARSSFRPETSRGDLDPVAALAAQFGVSVSSGEQGVSLDFYRKLIRSRAILTDLAKSEFGMVSPSGARRTEPLLQILGIAGSDEQERLNRAYTELLARVTVDLDRPAGTVDLAVSAPQGALAVAMNRRILDLVNAYNVQKRNSSAVVRRDFARQRMVEADSELQAADDALLQFLQRNRSFQSAPELVFQEQRLQRAVALRQQVYSSLAATYEQARVDAVKDIPVITIVYGPEGSVQRKGEPMRNAKLAFVLASILAVALVFVLEHVRAERAADPRAFRQLVELLPRALVRRWRGRG